LFKAQFETIQPVVNALLISLFKLAVGKIQFQIEPAPVLGVSVARNRKRICGLTATIRLIREQ
jgi:hypothetical protein